MTGEAVSLRGRIERLGDAFDLLAAYGDAGFLFERGGLGVATSGPAVATASPAVAARMLADVDRAIRGGGRTVAVVALPFRGGDGSVLSIASRTVRRSSTGETLRLDIGEATRAAPAPTLRPTGPDEPFRAAQLRARPPAADYAAAVADLVTRLRREDLRKVVLARTIEVAAGRRLDPRRLAHRLRAVNPDAYTFAAPTATGTIVGASPELLLSRFGREVRSNPLAGSAARAGDPAQDRENGERLLASAKDHEEHAIVVDAIVRMLEPHCRELSWDREPVLLETPNVWHLSTRFRGLLREPAPSALELVRELHPTPAVAGEPRDAAPTPVRSAGSTRAATANGRSPCDAPSCRMIARRCTPGRGSSRRAAPPTRWTKPIASSGPSSTRCAGADTHVLTPRTRGT